MPDFRHIVILTGAGLSAESGLATFRDKDGIWAKYDYREVATPEGFRATLSSCTNSTISGGAGLAGVTPNAAHFALARLEREHKGSRHRHHAEHRSPARGRGLAQPDPHARGAPESAVRAMRHAPCLAQRLLASRRNAPAATRKAACAPMSCGSARCPTHGAHLLGSRWSRSLHFYRHQRQRLSGGRLRGRGPGERRAYGGAEPRALGWRGPVPRGDPRPRDEVVPAYVERLLVDG